MTMVASKSVSTVPSTGSEISDKVALLCRIMLLMEVLLTTSLNMRKSCPLFRSRRAPRSTGGNVSTVNSVTCRALLGSIGSAPCP